MSAAAVVDFYFFLNLTVGMLTRVELLYHAEFSRNRSNRGRYMAIFRFSKMASAAILDFQNFKLLTVGQLKRVEMRRHAKFDQNRLNYGRDMSIFRFFKMAAAAILDFSNFKFLTADSSRGRNASPCQIWSKSVATRPRYGDFSIFQDGRRRHLGFLNF